jgi:signal transduction protein with GAF and PtsI domain
VSKSKRPDTVEPVLEAPPPPDASVSVLGSLFSDASHPLAQSAAKLSVLETFLEALTSNCSYVEFSREILLAFLRVVKSEAGTLFELDRSTGTLFFRAVAGRSSDIIAGFRVPMGQGAVGYVAESRQPLLVPNAEGNRIHLKTIQNAIGFETRNLVAVPIVIRGEVYGVLELINRVGEAAYSETDLELLLYLCDFAARAIELRLMIAWGAKAGKATQVNDESGSSGGKGVAA